MLKNVIFYQIFVRSFFDSNNDGIGDLNGIRKKLSYLKKLGVSAVWLSPIHPSPSYHKYDVIDYYSVDPEYGTIADFKKLVSEFQKAGIKVIIDFVVNHTSNKHPWFMESKKGASSTFHRFYVWKKDSAIKEYGGWYKDNSQQLSEESYFGHFCKEMPDLNYDNQEVRKRIIEIGRFWLKNTGIDGFRLDAAQHIYPESQHHKSISWWKEFREAMREEKKDIYLVGEVWSDEHVAAPYLQSMNAVFNFELGYRIIELVKSGKDLGILSKLKSINKLYKVFSTDYSDAIFLANHDQERIFSTFRGNLEKAKIAATILLTLPGVPFLYYGEELGMAGKKPDEYIREPIRWENKKTAKQWLNSKFNKKINSVSKQLKDKSSILSHYRKLIRLRRQNIILFEGEILPIDFKSNKVVAYIRRKEETCWLVIHNIRKDPLKLEIMERIRLQKLVFKSAMESGFSRSVISLEGNSSIIIQCVLAS